MDVQPDATLHHDTILPTGFVGKCSGDMEGCPTSPSVAPPTASRKDADADMEEDNSTVVGTASNRSHSEAIPSAISRSFDQSEFNTEISYDCELADGEQHHQQQQQQQQQEEQQDQAALPREQQQQHQEDEAEEELAAAAAAPPELARSTSNLTLSILLRSSSVQSITVMPETTCYSPWRMPDQVGKLPVYVERQFRIKALGTVALQSMITLCVMLLIDATGLLNLPPRYIQLSIFATFAALSLWTLRTLYASGVATVRRQLLLLFVALPFCAAAMWCSFGAILGLPVHLHMASIHTITMLLTTGYMAFQSDENRHQPIFLAISSFLLSWIVASFLQFVAAELTGLDCYVFTGVDFTSFILFTMATLQVCSRLAACDPDTFLGIILTLNSTLIVIVSIPFVWAGRGWSCLYSCLKRPHQEEQQELQQQQQLQQELQQQQQQQQPQHTSAALAGNGAADNNNSSNSSNLIVSRGGGNNVEAASRSTMIVIDGPDLEIGA